MKHLLSSIVILAAALSSQAVQAAKGGKPPSDAPATTTIRAVCAADVLAAVSRSAPSPRLVRMLEKKKMA